VRLGEQRPQRREGAGSVPEQERYGKGSAGGSGQEDHVRGE